MDGALEVPPFEGGEDALLNQVRVDALVLVGFRRLGNHHRGTIVAWREKKQGLCLKNMACIMT